MPSAHPVMSCRGQSLRLPAYVQDGVAEVVLVEYDHPHAFASECDRLLDLATVAGECRTRNALGFRVLCLRNQPARLTA